MHLRRRCRTFAPSNFLTFALFRGCSRGRWPRGLSLSAPLLRPSRTAQQPRHVGAALCSV